MSYERDIYQAVRSCAPVWSAIGGRFSWDIADADSDAPYIVAQTISDNGPTTHAGERGATFPTVQFSCWAKSKSQAVKIMDDFRKGIEGRNLPGESVVSLTFSSRFSTYESETRLFGIQCQYNGAVQFT